MKYILFICLNFFCYFTFAQENKIPERKLYMYKTFADLKNDTGEYKGTFKTTIINSWGRNTLFGDLNGEEQKVNANKYWGFRIGDFVFRRKNSRPKMLVAIIGVKEKVFYANGYVYLNMLLDAGGSMFHVKKPAFYSDDFESEIIDIDELIENEEGNESLSPLIDCLKKAADRYGYQAKFNGYTKCIREFTE